MFLLKKLDSKKKLKLKLKIGQRSIVERAILSRMFFFLDENLNASSGFCLGLPNCTFPRLGL